MPLDIKFEMQFFVVVLTLIINFPKQIRNFSLIELFVINYYINVL